MKLLLFTSLILMTYSQPVHMANTLSFEDLASPKIVEKAHEKIVTIRGFLYHKEDGAAILAAKPNIKTCCLGSPNNIKEQIKISGQVPNTALWKAIEVTGTFVISPQYNDEGNLSSLYLIELVSEN